MSVTKLIVSFLNNKQLSVGLKWLKFDDMNLFFYSVKSSHQLLWTGQGGEGKAFYRTQVYLGSDLWVLIYETQTPFWNLTDVTLADEDTNSIQTDDANKAIQGNVAM